MYKKGVPFLVGLLDGLLLLGLLLAVLGRRLLGTLHKREPFFNPFLVNSTTLDMGCENKCIQAKKAAGVQNKIKVIY